MEIALAVTTVRRDRWAVQATTDSFVCTLDPSAFDSVPSEASRPGSIRRLLVASTHRVGPMARRTIGGQAGPVERVLLDPPAGDRVPWPASRPTRPPGRSA